MGSKDGADGANLRSKWLALSPDDDFLPSGLCTGELDELPVGDLLLSVEVDDVSGDDSDCEEAGGELPSGGCASKGLEDEFEEFPDSDTGSGSTVSCTSSYRVSPSPVSSRSDSGPKLTSAPSGSSAMGALARMRQTSLSESSLAILCAAASTA
eukprot:CAMPEP_0169289660 /NCGR_PEP_ID=MMETSP1016-20121227/61271_2 /TAXON_ID=342587 /ORGANISM="Karlodinium micrum, Strain CCMP2283" /LENGTH=153 /DNA_ID=CAMNT_0009380091 /DNA_START=284 /DNA_END=745 /DNA_ORIENTATION=-